MARKIVDIGAVGNDGTGDSIRDSFRKVNDNFRELYSSLGLGEKLTFIGLDDTPVSYAGQNNPTTGSTPVLTVNNTESGIAFKQLVGGTGITLDFSTNDGEIAINSAFAEISADDTPQLGGDLSARSGGNQYRIIDLGTTSSPLQPIFKHEAANKAYVDTKISRAGIDAIDPETGLVNAALGRMSGPLLLSRDPEPEDDELYGGLVAATKRYVDNAAFGSSTNLYVALSGEDSRPGVSKSLQGRALAYAYRTLEAALKRAEELVLEAPVQIGPYKKVLTYNAGAGECYLALEPYASPSSGTGFSGVVRMGVDTATINSVGINYFPGDILTLSGGTLAPGGGAATIEVLSTATTPGAILTFRIISTGSYAVLPGATAVATTITTSAAPPGVPRTNTATFNITYKVNSVAISLAGTGYSLVSVRITGGGGRGAFGVAAVTNGAITGITITDQGSGFTSLPTLRVDLPRFAIFTAGFRTDYTGDVTTETSEAIRGRDIREGLYLRGEESGALAQILSHQGELDSFGNELFDVDIKNGAFIVGEAISYGDISKDIQITVLVESGEYYENYPLKVPQNTSVVGDEFRRCIIRPLPGTSSSPWAFQKFRRDITIDGMPISTQPYGHHYLQDSTSPVYPKINNKGAYRSAAALLELNRDFIAEEIIAWMNYNVTNNISPFTSTFVYNQELCKRDVGLLIDAFTFDLKYGDYNRTISAGLKYYQGASALIAITTQLSQYLAVMDYIDTLAQDIINNVTITTVYQTLYSQIVDLAFQSESGSGIVITALIAALKDVIDGSGSVNYPKENNAMDVFLANDAVRWQAISAQGHGGFMGVLDPTGQILAKSPYFQECASFSRSIDAQTFAGGMFVDGFSGNLQFKHVATDVTNTRLSVSNLDRFPQLPGSFLVDDSVYRINYVRDFVYSPSGSTATFVLDETNPFTRAPGAQTCTISVGNPAVITKVDHRLQSGSTIVFTNLGGALPAGIETGKEYYVTGDGLTNDTFNITETFGSITKIITTNAGSGTNSYQRTYELLMPGNRSMLANDFTQINDMGYGAIAANGGLIELVSMFTYYTYISYYSLTGGQIRSIGGSSAHGIYALVAEGADPLEVPTPTSVYEELAQRVDCYYPSPSYANTTGGLFIYVNNYDYAPLADGELEIDHSGVIFRYPMTSATTTDLPPGVARLNLSAGAGGTTEGLFAQVPDGTKMTLRINGQLLLTGGLEDVAVRPSTGLKLRETEDAVYRVLQFSTYTDLNGPYEITISNGSPAVLRVLATITDITGTDTCTTSQNHKLKLGDVFIPTSTTNGLTSGTTYYITSVPAYNQFTLSTIPGGSSPTLTNGSGLAIKGYKSHKLIENYTVFFTTTGTLPSPLISNINYYVSSTGLTETEFSISSTRAGNLINTTTSGSGTHSYALDGITRTNLRENYNYNDLTLWQPGEFVTSGTTCTISIGSPATITLSGHTFNAGDVVKFTTTGFLPTGLSILINYHVLSAGLVAGTSFRVSQVPGGTAVDTSGSQSGTHQVGLVQGRAGDDSIAVVAVGPNERSRIAGSKFVFKGEEYVIDTYESEIDTGEAYARIILDRPLVDSMIAYGSAYTIKSAVPIRSNGALGTLTIRISLTRVTSHDLLEIGTGSYADTNYPKEIYGQSVNPINENTEVAERDVGRVFYVTTDQYGNFKVGPYFKVDQGTGTVTFSSSIALSNLDGIGFKRGVPVSEFSTDSAFTDSATDTVPTENATRTYIERRLGLSHDGLSVVDSGQLIPSVTGGYMPLYPIPGVAMKADMNLGNNKINTLSDPTDAQDAVNLRSLTFNNFQDFSSSSVDAADILVFTGNANNAVNATVVGDVTFNLRPGVDSALNQIDVQINSDTIINADIKSDAAIDQTKLSLDNAYATNSTNIVGATATGSGSVATLTFSSTFLTAPFVTGQRIVVSGLSISGYNGTHTVLTCTTNSITYSNTTTGSAGGGTIRPLKGISTFDAAQFTVTDGFVTLRSNGTPINRLEQIASRTVLGNSTLGTANVDQVAFSSVIDLGLGVKKNQYSSTGFLRRTSAVSNTADGDYTIVEAAAGSSASVEAGKLIIRDVNGDFGGRIVDISQLKMDTKVGIDTSTTATGGFIRYYGWDTAGGILVQNGSLAADKKTAYWNDAHNFKTQDGLSDAPITASLIQVQTLTTGGNTTPGTITGRWTLSGSSPNESRLQATYSADLAEYYEGDKDYPVGTVLVFGGDKEVTTTNIKADTRVAGVVSNTAAFAMYEACPGLKNLVALQGRVPCRVAGKITKGDILITAGIPGVAVAATGDVKVGTVVGKALVDYDSDHIGTIEIAVGRT